MKILEFIKSRIAELIIERTKLEFDLGDRNKQFEWAFIERKIKSINIVLKLNEKIYTRLTTNG